MFIIYENSWKRYENLKSLKLTLPTPDYIHYTFKSGEETVFQMAE